MVIRVITRSEVRQLLDMSTCIDLVETAHQRLQEKKGYQPLRTSMVPKNAKGILATMPAFLGGDDPVLGLKVVSVFHENHKLGLESHQGAIILMNTNTGQLEAIIDGAEITAMRTAAASGVATKYLARKDSKTLALIGTGVQAHSHLQAITSIMDIEQILVWNRTESKAESFADQHKDDYNVVVSNLTDTLQADIICTLTASSEPLFDIDGVPKGVHINAVGASQNSTRELGSGFVKGAKWFTDVYESIINEAGALIIPKQKGEIQDMPRIIELGALVTGDHPGRQTIDEITIYKSLGVGIQDLAPANYVLNEAKKKGLGTEVDF